MSQQEDDLRALAKIMDFLRATSIVLVIINIYWFCPELHPTNPDGFFTVVDKVLNGFDRSCTCLGRNIPQSGSLCFCSLCRVSAQGA
jgi:hypothetical protein